MPRFYFDAFDGDKVARDTEGVDLPDLMAARDEAQQALPEIAREVLPDGERRMFACTVRDGDGTALYRVALTLTGNMLPPPGRNSTDALDDAPALAKTLLRTLGQHDALTYTTTKMQDHRELGDLAGAVAWGKVSVAIVDEARIVE